MSLINILFIVVMLHLVVGFGYALYKIEYGGKKEAKNNSLEDDENIEKE
jgi:hypothetical protein